MITARLMSIPEAAKILGVPAASLRTEADRHGKTIRIGRVLRLHPDDLPELIARAWRLIWCQGQEDHASSGYQSQSHGAWTYARHSVSVFGGTGFLFRIGWRTADA